MAMVSRGLQQELDLDGLTGEEDSSTFSVAEQSSAEQRRDTAVHGLDIAKDPSSSAELRVHQD